MVSKQVSRSAPHGHSNVHCLRRSRRVGERPSRKPRKRRWQGSTLAGLCSLLQVHLCWSTVELLDKSCTLMLHSVVRVVDLRRRRLRPSPQGASQRALGHRNHGDDGCRGRSSHGRSCRGGGLASASEAPVVDVMSAKSMCNPPVLRWCKIYNAEG